METYVALLQTYQGRDKILRTVSYACGFATGGFKSKIAKDLGVIAQRISSARTINRLFDDIPMLTVTRTWGASDKDGISRVLTALANLSIQLYFPLEKIAWASDNEILALKSAPWWDAGLAAWAIYLVLHIFRSLRQLVLLKYRVVKVLRQRKLESPDRSGEQDQEFRTKLAELRANQHKEFLMLIKNTADVVMCINWLPLGVLWSGKLSPAKNSFFGLVSSLIGLHMSVVQYQGSKSKKP